jgi:hypothetical protein
MSTTIPTTAATAIEASTSVTTLRANLQTAMANGASDVPAAIKALSVLDPDLAPKALIASKSPWGTVAVALVSMLATKYGLSCGAVVTATCWSTDTVNEVAGAAALLGTLVGSYIMRYVTSRPISGIVSAPTPPAPSA